MVRRRLVLIIVAAILLATGFGIAAWPFAQGLSLVIRAADLHGASRTLADVLTVPVVERLLDVPVPGAATRARVYTPGGRSRQTVLLVSGLHPAGIDEPRLVFLARELSKSHVTVLTPEIPELTRFEITPLLTDRLERIAVWLAIDSGLAPTGRIGLMGVSFSGGLSIVAAGRPSLRNHLSYVFSFGGHDDLPRVLGYLCTGHEPGRLPRGAPHDYGLAVFLLVVADQLVPPEQAPVLRDAVRRFLWASYVTRVDKRDAEQEFAALRALARKIPDPSATLLRYVNERDVASLGRRLLSCFETHAEAAALSPARSPDPTAPVFLLHGTDDNVIPASESLLLAERLRPHQTVRLLLTDLISHADADRPPHVRSVVALARFWGDLLTR